MEGSAPRYAHIASDSALRHRSLSVSPGCGRSWTRERAQSGAELGDTARSSGIVPRRAGLAGQPDRADNSAALFLDATAQVRQRTALAIPRVRGTLAISAWRRIVRGTRLEARSRPAWERDGWSREDAPVSQVGTHPPSPRSPAFHGSPSVHVRHEQYPRQPLRERGSSPRV